LHVPQASCFRLGQPLCRKVLGVHLQKCPLSPTDATAVVQRRPSCAHTSPCSRSGSLGQAIPARGAVKRPAPTAASSPRGQELAPARRIGVVTSQMSPSAPPSRPPAVWSLSLPYWADGAPSARANAPRRLLSAHAGRARPSLRRIISVSRLRALVRMRSRPV